MTSSTAIEPVSQTLQVPGATLTYDVRSNDSSSDIPLFMIGSSSGAGGFPSLASHFTVDTETARRLFTLVYALHVRG